MKTNRFLTIVLGLIATIAITSCVQDDDYTVPESLGDEENMGLNQLIANSTPVTVAEAKSYFVPGEVTEITTDVYVKGYVSSSDRTGNFYKEFFIQDSPSNPTDAIKVILNQVDSYNQFNFGREVYINLNGLFIGEVRGGDGVITIGGDRNADNEVEQLTENLVPAKIFRSQVTEVMEPLTVTFSQIDDSHIGMYVMIENAHFPSYLSGEFYVDPFDDFDTTRELEACEGFGYSSFPLETSSFADFAQQPLPVGMGGSISAVVSKTFNGSNLVLALNSTEDVNFDGAICTPLSIDDFTAVFEEDFESMTNNSTVSGNGWTAYAEEGGFNWRVITTSDNGNPGSKIASMGAYNSGDPSNIAWLISPAIDLDSQDLEFVNFETSNSFDDDSELELLISTDWDGTEAGIATATWTTLPGTIVSDDVYYQDWVDSGLIDLSGYSGNAYVAFKYIGGDNSANTIDGNYEIDNFRVLVQN